MVTGSQKIPTKAEPQQGFQGSTQGIVVIRGIIRRHRGAEILYWKGKNRG